MKRNLKSSTAGELVLGNPFPTDPSAAASKAYVDSVSSNGIYGNSVIYSKDLNTNQQEKFTIIAPSISGVSYDFVAICESPDVTVSIDNDGLMSVKSSSYGVFSIIIKAVGNADNVLTKTVSFDINEYNIEVDASKTLPSELETSTNVSYDTFVAVSNIGTLSYELVRGYLPEGLFLNTTTGYIEGTTGNSATIGETTHLVIRITNGIKTIDVDYVYTFRVAPIPGQALFGTNTGFGTFSWIAPEGVTEVSVVCVGGGGSGRDSWANSCGSGAGLGWKNNIPVVPGQSYTVQVGAGGDTSAVFGGTEAYAGGDSYFISKETVAGYGGGNSQGGRSYGPNSNSTYGGGWQGDGGGAGGYASNYQGGGGAGGYTGNGGNGMQPAATNSGGSAGGGYYSSTYGTSAGGGTGLLGKGKTGVGFISPWSTSQYGGGEGGSGGENGMYGENPWSGSGQSSSNLQGGAYGGGGGGPGTSWPSASGKGGQGGVRIIWGLNRAYPDTNTSDV